MSDALKRIAQSIPALATIIQTEHRNTQTPELAILDMSYKALIVNVPKIKRDREAFESVYSKIVYACIKGVGKNKFSSMKSGEFLRFISRTAGLEVALINGGPDNFYLIGRSESMLKSFVSTHVSNNSSVKATRFGSGLELEVNSSDALVEQLTDIINFSGGLIGAQGSRIRNVAVSAIDEINSIRGELVFSLTSKGVPQDILRKGFIELNLFTQGSNNQLKDLEKHINQKVLKELSLIVKATATLSLEADIVQDYNDKVTEILTGKKPSVRKPKKSEVIKAGFDVKTIKTAVTVFKPNNKPLRNTDTGRFVSLVSLTELINQKLHDQIRKNMGKGSAKTKLNYRSSRFAKSVQVEYLTKTRNDEINAFYSYMKYPYQTFEPGFKQGAPESRDPKKLISKSIREIATSIVTTRLKAILV